MIDYSFPNYVKRAQGASQEKLGFADEYAYNGDLRILKTLEQLGPVNVCVESVVRFYKAFARNDLLGNAVLASDRQFPAVMGITRECSQTLGIPCPDVYIIQRLDSLNAMTYGTNEDSFVLVHSATVDHLGEEELRTVIGHECGHIQNGHVVYMTALHHLLTTASMFFQWIGAPAKFALLAWSRRAEITADRAGMICCRNPEVAVRTMVKFALGSQKLYQEVDLDEYLSQLEGVKTGLGRLKELLRAHPYLPKRLQALKLFADSAPFRSRVLGLEGGTSKSELDKQVSQLISVL